MSHSNPLARHGGLSYLEVPTSDPRRSADFYARVLGWTIDERTPQDIRFAAPDGLLIGRFAPGHAIAREPGLRPFLYVDDLDAAVARVTAHGGEIVQGPYPEGDLRAAKVRDPSGNPLGLWQFGAAK
jgi:predicted enzyme related to lactoylglutathione lyase